jgi:Plasmid replication region DNA-binding N-term
VGRHGINNTDVVIACVALLKQHRTISTTNIRLELGRGSYTTINQHLKRLAFVSPRRLRASLETPSHRAREELETPD